MINLYKKHLWGVALVVSLLALSLALAGCSEPEVEGSDITGAWVDSFRMGITCTFNSDGTAIFSLGEYPTMSGTWSLNGTTVALNVSYSDNDSGDAVSMAITYTYNNGSLVLDLESSTIEQTEDGQTTTMTLATIAGGITTLPFTRS